MVFALIAYQDFKDRAVYWFLFPVMGILLGIIYFSKTLPLQYVITSMYNILIISIIVLVLFAYTRYIAKKKFLDVSFGLGDFLFFYAFALGFPTYTFLLLFVGSILFALAAHLALNRKRDFETIPLAGLMGIFLIGVTLASRLPHVPSLYSL